MADSGQLILDLLPADPPLLDNFVPGPNLEALAAVNGGAIQPPPQCVYLWGGSGYGKTHLLQGASRGLNEQGLQIAYLPMQEAADWSAELLLGLEQMQLVCIDDIHAIAGQQDWEQALFHLFNGLRDAGHRLLVSANVAPRELPLQLPDLQSRLGWGLVLQLQELEEVDKVQALSARARQRGFDLTLEVADYLLKRCPRDMHSLFTLLDTLDQASIRAQRKLTLPFVRRTLGF